VRVLTLAHGHPSLRPGGAEAAALALHYRLRDVEGVEPVLVARADPATIGHAARFGALDGMMDQILAAPPGEDGFLHESADLSILERMVRDLCDRFRPDLVHVQHWLGWSLDVVPLFRALGIPVVLSLHELLLPCHRDGQMVKTDGRLCHAASPVACAACFPHHPPGDFHLRRRVLLDRLAGVARFVAPSRFLAARHVAWGLPADRVSVIDYPLSPDLLAAPPPEPRVPDGRVRIGFFGQLTPYKGADLLLDAAARLDDATARRLAIDVHGIAAVPPDHPFARRLADLEAAAGRRARLVGPYAQGTAVRMMRDYDWIVVPSLWWENSPLVIQEAQAAGRPVLAADIGGMAEKVGPGGAPGRLFSAGDPAALAAALARIVAENGAPPPGEVRAIPADEAGRVDAWLAVYRAAVATA